ncbi:hypothetical protein JW868_04410 [Candidatus Woesearchaeota archaeon]|nr:hypothetical protein [Candidatus Woesearchaeota archaeon]
MSLVEEAGVAEEKPETKLDLEGSSNRGFAERLGDFVLGYYYMQEVPAWRHFQALLVPGGMVKYNLDTSAWLNDHPDEGRIPRSLATHVIWDVCKVAVYGAVLYYSLQG